MALAPALHVLTAALPAIALTALFAVSRSRRSRAARRAVATDTCPLAEALADHARKIARVSRQLRGRTSTRPLSLRKRAVAHQVPRAGDRRRTDDKLDISDLDQILHIDPERRICIAEPGVTFVDLVAATLRHGLVPYTVPELETITIGGAVAGGSIESMSHRHGGFHDSCLEYEVITAKGDVLTCTPDNEHRLVFQMMHFTFGTLGILSKLTFRLAPARPFVKLVHETYTTIDGYLAAIRRHSASGAYELIDGIIHSPTKYVLCLGNFVDRAPYTNRYDWMKIYWKSTAERTEDYLTTPDYFFRYNRGITNVRPRSWLGRLLFGKLVDSTRALRVAERLPWLLRKRQPTVMLDVFVPIGRVAEFMDWYQRTFRFFPLWCVPYRCARDYEWLQPRYHDRADDRLFLDLAIYGMKQTGGVNYHRLMEQELPRFGGIKTLISHNYYGEDEFWTIWDRANYDRVKAITDPDNVFRDLYTKTCRAVMGLPDAPAPAPG
jgi:FAD/FMN-containing dehydrogenase